VPEDSRYRAAGFAIARSPVLVDGPDRPRLPGDLTDPREFLLSVVSDPVVAEAITVSSSALGAILDRVASGAAVEPKRLRGAAFSVARYLSRMTHRATPFGLLAGVTSVQFQDGPKARVGTRHRRGVRVDMGWLSAVLQSWETDPAVLPHLTLVANDLSFMRGDRLVLPYPREDWAPDREHSVAHTRAVAATIAAARTPIRYPDLVSELPDAEPEIRMLIEQEFLLTDLRPPSSADDPLEHVLTVLAPLPRHAGRDTLLRVRQQLRDYAETPLGGGLDLWRRATATMRSLHDASDRLIQVDLRLDADLLLPHEVATEVERAATVAWRISAPGSDRLAGYRARFLERYGPGAVVPVQELLDPHTGLGPPDGYLLPPARRTEAAPTAVTDRDRLLIALAQRPGAREVVLDDELVERLARPGSDTEAPTYTEAAFQLLAESEESLADGDFLVELTQTFPRPGELFGRFLHLLPELSEAVTEVALETVGEGAAQVENMHLHPRNANVTQVPTLLDESIRVGVFADRTRPDVHGLGELGVGADQDAFFLVSLRTGQRVVPLPLHALNPRLTVPNPIRFLYEIGEQDTPRWPAWDWGQAANLPYLPRIRHGRTVLAPARWLVDPRLRDITLEVAEWSRLFEQWRTDWSPADIVDVVREDQRVRVDLTHPGERLLLRDELGKPREVVLQEVLDVGTGWAHGHAVEIALPLCPLKTVHPTRTLRVAPSVAFLPGGEWLDVKVFAEEPRHGELLGRWLGALLEHALPLVDRWFFVRNGDDPHLRLRFHGDPVALNTRLLPALHDWAADLVSRRLIREIALDTYRPEILRYGGPELIELAERAFHADSRSVLEQLALRERGRIGLPIEWLLAANTLDLAARLHGDGWQDWLLEAIPKNSWHGAFQRHRDAIMSLGPEQRWRGLARFPGGDLLLASWQRRAVDVAAYGTALRASELDSPTPAFLSLLRLHHNRLTGIDADREQTGYAIARGMVAVTRDRARHHQRSGRSGA
jgi:thiopeptide-type bacteriocin biosynthesis protein